jgi:hypothetical protein
VYGKNFRVLLEINSANLSLCVSLFKIHKLSIIKNMNTRKASLSLKRFAAHFRDLCQSSFFALFIFVFQAKPAVKSMMMNHFFVHINPYCDIFIGLEASEKDFFSPTA